MSARRIADMSPADRIAAVDEHVGGVRVVTYRGNKALPYDRTLVGVVLGASHHVTNGTSTGDLILRPKAGYTFTTGTPLVSIALANVASIGPDLS